MEELPDDDDDDAAARLALPVGTVRSRVSRARRRLRAGLQSRGMKLTF